MMEHNVWPMIIQHYTGQVTKLSQTLTCVLATLVTTTLIFSLTHNRYVINVIWLEGAMEMHDTIVLRMVMEHNPLRLTPNRWFSSIRQNIIRPICYNFDHSIFGYVIKVGLTYGG